MLATTSQTALFLSRSNLPDIGDLLSDWKATESN